MRYKLESTLTVGGGAVLKNLDCEWQKFLLAHRRWGTFRETSLSGDELGETSVVRRLTKLLNWSGLMSESQQGPEICDVIKERTIRSTLLKSTAHKTD